MGWRGRDRAPQNPGMDLNELAVFVEVVRAGSFTAAGRELHLPKSTVSRRVSDLEARLGSQLLQRTTRKVGLTDVGRAFYERCSRVVADAREAERLVAEAQAVPSGTLRVTAPPMFGFLGPVVADYLRRHPGVQVEMVCTERRVDLVGEGFDVAVRAGRLEDSTHIARRLGALQLALVAAPAYLRARGTPRTPADLRRHETIAFSADDEEGTWTLASARSTVEVPLRPRLVSNDYDLILEAACAGVGVSRIPAFRCQRALEAGDLVALLPRWRSREIPIHAVYPSGRHPAPKLRAFLDLLKTQFAPRSGAR